MSVYHIKKIVSKSLWRTGKGLAETLTSWRDAEIFFFSIFAHNTFSLLRAPHTKQLVVNKYLLLIINYNYIIDN